MSSNMEDVPTKNPYDLSSIFHDRPSGNQTWQWVPQTLR